MRYLAIEEPPTAPTGEVIALPPVQGTAGPRPRRRRRSWTLEQKLAIVREAKESGDPVAVVARRHGMNANHLFMWIDQAENGSLGQHAGAQSPPAPEPMKFIDLGVVGSKPAADRVAAPGPIEIELSGGERVRVTPPVDADALRLVLSAVKSVL